MNEPLSEADLQRLLDWSLARATEIRHLAAALGWPAEYAFLKRRDHLEALLRRDLPGTSTQVLEWVCSDCQRSDIELSLTEINRLRDENGLPPLDFIPEVQAVPHFPPPKVRVPPSQDDERALFIAWMMTKVSDAHHAAAARGISARDAMFAVPSLLVSQIIRRFPGLNPATCLHDLDFGIMAYRPETLDPARVASMKEWSDTMKDVGDQIEAKMQTPTTPKLKQ
jgi:hypothetical protein